MWRLCTLRVRALGLEAQPYESENYNPELALPGRFDWLFTLTYLTPLLVIVPLHDLKSGERKTVCRNGAKRTRFVAAADWLAVGLFDGGIVHLVRGRCIAVRRRSHKHFALRACNHRLPTVLGGALSVYGQPWLELGH